MRFRTWLGFASKGIAPIVAALLLIPCAAAADAIPMVDAHSQVDTAVDMEQVLSAMDEAGISHAILSSLHGASRTRDIVDFAKRRPGRITPSIGLKDRRYREGEAAALERVRKMAAAPAFGALSGGD